MVERPATYVTYPGSFGQFQWAPNINELDSDTAHVVQSRGLWTEPRFNFTPDATPTADAGSPYGASSFGGVTNGVGTANTYLRIPFGADAFPVSPGQEKAAQISVKPEFATTRTFRIVLWWLDSGGAFLSQDNGPSTVLAANEYGKLSHSATAPASAAFLSIGWEMETGASVADGSRIMLAAASIRNGSDPAFYPSQRIVGDIDLRYRVAHRTYVTGGAEVQVMGTDGGSGSPRGFKTGIIEASGNVQMRCVYWTAGAAQVLQTSPAYLGLNPGDEYEGRVTIEHGTGTVKFYKDGVQLGTDQSATPGAVDNGTDLQVGAMGNGTQNWDGRILWAEARDGLDGPVVVDYYPDDQGQGVELTPEAVILPWPPPPIEPIGLP